MFVAKKRVEYKSRKQEFRFTPLGDVHLGSSSCDEEAFQEEVAKIADDPFCYTLLMGDMTEAIAPDDKRWDEGNIADWLYTPQARRDIIGAQKAKFLEMLRPIPSERILGVLEGNHELTIRNKHKGDLAAEYARELGVPYLGSEGFVSLLFQRSYNSKSKVHRFIIFACHGHGAGRKPGSKVNNIKDLAGFINADIFCMGHVHERMGFKDCKLGLDYRNRFISKERCFMLTGTFMKTYQEGAQGYAARALYAPTAIGTVTAHIWPDSRESQKNSDEPMTHRAIKLST